MFVLCVRSVKAGPHLPPCVIRGAFESATRAKEALNAQLSDFENVHGRPVFTSKSGRKKCLVYYDNSVGDAIWIEETTYDAVPEKTETNDRYLHEDGYG